MPSTGPHFSPLIGAFAGAGLAFAASVLTLTRATSRRGSGGVGRCEADRRLGIVRLRECSGANHDPRRMSTAAPGSGAIRPDARGSMTQSENGPARNLVEPDDHIFGHFIRSVRDYAILMLDPSGRIISSNAGAEHIKGYRAHEIIGSHFSRFYPAQQVTEGHPDKELLIAARDGHFEDEGWRLRKDGSRFWANVIITALRDEAGALFGYATVTRDMTERRREEETLRQSEERYRALVSGVRDYAIFILDPDGFVTTWNAGAEYIKGYQAHEIIGSHFSRFYPPESIKSGLPERELRGATLDGRFEDEGWRVRKDGSRFWANVIITAMRDTSGKLIGFSKITRNLTDRRRQEENLRLSEERFRLLVEGVTEYAIIMLDRDGFVSSWNGGAERINGYKSHEILGKHLSNFYSSEDIAANRPWRHLATARDKGRSTEEGWRVRKDGTLFWSSTVITALTDGEGKPYGFAQVTQDLTQRRHAEALADTTQRMHEFIAMLAHELRNPLAPISNAVALMARKGARRSSARSDAPDDRKAERASHPVARRTPGRQPHCPRPVRGGQGVGPSSGRARARPRDEPPTDRCAGSSTAPVDPG